MAASAAFAPAAETIWLPSPTQPVRAPPPLGPGASAISAPSEQRVPGRVASREVVDVGIGPDGAPVRVTATQRLSLRGTGDYDFIVAAPATSAVRGPGSESSPGLRRSGILWQGFADRGRVLSSAVGLQPSAAAAGLPLRVRVVRRAGAVQVQLANVARRTFYVSSGPARRSSVFGALRTLRARYRESQVVTERLPVAGVGASRLTKAEAVAPLRVTGVIAAGSSRRTVDEVLSGGARERALVVVGPTMPKLRLRVELLPPLEILPTARELARARDPLVTLETAVGSVATAQAYRRYLGSPDPSGASEALFVYRSAPRVKVAAAAAGRDRGGSDAPTIALASLLGLAGLVGATWWWARS